MNESRIAVTNSRGKRIWVDPLDARGQALIDSQGDFNPSSLKLWSVAMGLRTWGAVVDVGCNYGEMLVGVDLPAAARVVAFEPSEAVLPYLRATVAELPTSVEVVALAVSSVSQQNAVFLRDAEWSGTSGLAETGGSKGQVVEYVTVTTLDDFFADRAFTTACIKIDVEGADLEVVEGAAKLLDSLDEWAVMIEILHLEREQIAELTRRFALYLLDRRTSALVRVSEATPAALEEILASGWVYAQDALLVSPRIAATLSEGNGSSEQLVQAARSIREREAFTTALETQLADIRSSKAWRITAPLRAASDRLRRKP